MSHSRSLEQASGFARAALDRMIQLGIPPEPENFAIWYAYFSDSMPELRRTIDILLSNGQEFTEERNRELYARFIGFDREGEAISVANRRIQEALGSVMRLLDAAGRDNSRYGDNLASLSARLDAGSEIRQLRRIVEALAEETRAMAVYNRRLGCELTATSQQMVKMQVDLESVRKEAMTDALTGLANRKSFDLGLREAVAAALEGGRPLCLLMVDIDHFKKFNDSYGHQTGDEVLRLVARVLKDSVKGQDTAARYGGEEFAIVLPDTALNDAVTVAERIRDRMSSRQIIRRNKGETLGSITLSIGAAQFDPGEPMTRLIRRADAALYTAKRTGRNRVSSDPSGDVRTLAG
ncbi:MAG TPA: GGDEF domain-containing protein [Alphaproteobacteria bacterium]|nr:GGDEF domain-containing protein [Alphaproteobacteria bacterium]